MNFFSFIFVL